MAGSFHGVLSMTLLLFFLCSLSFVIIDAEEDDNRPPRGCYWSESCESKWIGSCEEGDVVVDQSEDCRGSCSKEKFPPCLPFYTHFRCCKPEFPKLTAQCTKCDSFVDLGDEYLCCMDCSDPFITDKNKRLGYCKTGAKLAVQIKLQEYFSWVAGPWMDCSSPCGGGVRYRDVSCFGSSDDSEKQYLVDDGRCTGLEMPARQEPCNLRNCEDFSGDPNPAQKRGMATWLIILLVFVGALAIAGLGVGGFVFYKRRSSSQGGFVYIMLEGYS